MSKWGNGYNGIDLYSTDEVKTNEVWTDGKPIYRKCVPISQPDTPISLTALNIDTPIKAQGQANYDNKKVTLPLSVSGLIAGANFYFSPSEITLWKASNLSYAITDINANIFYTKTTD